VRAAMSLPRPWSPPDGYTLLFAGLPNAINASLYSKLNFNFIHDIAPIASIVRAPNVMVVNPSFPVKTLAEFIAYAKTNPRKVNMASAGIGTTSHLAGELFKMLADVDLVHVPYRGNGPALTAVLGGQVEVQFPSPPSSIEYIRTGKLRGLGVTSAMRSEPLPDPSSDRRVCSRLRDQQLVRRGRAKGHASRRHRQNQQGD